MIAITANTRDMQRVNVVWDKLARPAREAITGQQAGTDELQQTSPTSRFARLCSAARPYG
jgi:hypothetical protein